MDITERATRTTDLTGLRVGSLVAVRHYGPKRAMLRERVTIALGPDAGRAGWRVTELATFDPRYPHHYMGEYCVPDDDVLEEWFLPAA